MRFILAFVLASGFWSCNQSQSASANNPINKDKQFDSFKSVFVDHLWKMFPGWASSQGYHKYDSVLVVYNEARIKNERSFASAWLDSLNKYTVESLGPNNKTDYYLIENQLKSFIWNIDKFRSYEWNPAEYNVGGGFAEILSSKHASAENKLKDIGIRLSNVPAYFEAAKKNIKNPTAEHTQLAIDQNQGSLGVFDMIADSINKSALGTHEREMYLAKVNEAKAAINDYITFLKELKNPDPRSFRLGKELYNEKFNFDIQSSFSAEQIYQRAVTRKEEIQVEMFKITSKLWSKHFKEKMPQDSLIAIRMMIDKLSLNHVAPDSFQISIEKQIPELVEFIKKKNLVYIDPSKPLVVRREPDYMSGVAGASISAPGPYDKNANTYYNVGSLSGWSKEDAESYLREYNDYILQILNIHEAIPGHYTQLVYSNQSPSIIKSILGNGAMIEGWAVYTERMMLEEGYGNDSPEMWLMYYKWHLRTVCNTILDYSVHVLNMQETDAINLLQNEAFQQAAEAKGKWRRATLTQVQLCSYFTGYTEIYELREGLKKKLGADFNLKKFHETFLSYGSAPVKYIKPLIEKELK